MIFADATGLPVKAAFTDGGQPITFSLFEEPVLEVNIYFKTSFGRKFVFNHLLLDKK